MSELRQPDPVQQLSHQAYYQLVHTLCSLLPLPLTDTPEALLTRNQAAIAKVAALAPVNADEADIAAHCVAARAQAEDVLRLARYHAADIQVVMKLTAQFALMERTAVSLRNQLLRLQTARQKREANSDAANADEWTTYIAARKLQTALDQREPPAVPQAEQPMPAPSLESPAVPVPAAQPPLAATQAARHACPRPPAVAPPRRNRVPVAAQSEEPPRNLAAEADYYALVYPRRAGQIRRYGGLPPDCDFGPPDDALIHAIVSGNSPALLALDAPAAATG